MVRIQIRRMVVWFFLISALLMVAARARADAPVHATLTADRAELTVGDPVQITLEVTHPDDYQVIIPPLDPQWGAFEVRNQSQATTADNQDGTETTRQQIEVTAFNLGDLETPGLPLTVSDGAGQITEVLVAPISLSVIPTLAEDDNELRDIKPQAALEVPATWPWLVAGLLVALVVGAGGYWVYRRRRGQPLFAPSRDNRPPWQVALDELTRIEGLGLVEQRRLKEHYTLVTDALRAYLEKQFNLCVFEHTTSEIKPVLGQSDLAPEHTRRLLELFTESDLVKFAKLTPDDGTAQQLVVEARQLVEMTRPPLETGRETSTTQEPPRGPYGRPGEKAATRPTPRLGYQSRQ